jgi:hypothetical protein
MANAYIPYGVYWSTPFAKWQGSIAHLNSIRLAANCARRMLDQRKIDGQLIDLGILGITNPQLGSFYGLPWLTGMMGLDRVPGPTVQQACATSARVLQHGGAGGGAGQRALRAGRDRRPLLERPHRLLPRPDRAGRQRSHRKVGDGQFRPRPVRQERDDRHRRERGAAIRRRHRRDERGRAAPLRPVPGRARQRPRVPEALHAGRADHRRGLSARRSARSRPTKASFRPRSRAWPS